MLFLQVFIRNNCPGYIGCYSSRRQLHFEYKVQLKMLVACADLEMALSGAARAGMFGSKN
jgi:hypothetical protein